MRRYFTNLDGPVFALVNLPEVVKGALFARYSRSPKSLRRLFLDEFVGDLDVSGDQSIDATVGLRRAEELYEKVFVEYGDDSVAQLGGVHIACEQASNVLTKVLEWGRLMSYLEQSTRYIAYDARLGGRYRFYRDPAVLASRLGTRYVGDMDRLFDAYSLDPRRRHRPRPGHRRPSPRRQRLRVPPGHPGQGARRRARHPAGRLAFQRRHLRQRPGVRGVAAAPARPPAARGPRLRRADAARAAQGDPELPAPRRRRRAWRALEHVPRHRPASARPSSSSRCSPTSRPAAAPSVTLVDFDPEAEDKLLAAICYPHSHLPEEQLLRTVARLGAAERLALVRAYVGERENRRHKPGRAFERIDYRFDVLSDYGAFRDLQRHRLLTIEWQAADARATATCVRSSSTPPARRARSTTPCTARPGCTTRSVPDFPEQAAYAVSMAYRIRYVMQFNAREAIHLLELRSGAQGHPAYRRVALEMHRLIAEQAGHRAVAEAMTHLTTEAPELERLAAERRAEARRSPCPCDCCHTCAFPDLGERARRLRPRIAEIGGSRRDDEVGERARHGS